MEDATLIIIGIIVFLTIISSIYYYRNRTVSQSPYEQLLKDYSTLVTSDCYNLEKDPVNFPNLPNYSFSGANPARATPDSDTPDLRATLQLHSAMESCNNWCIFNAKTKDAWAWDPNNRTWVRQPYATYKNNEASCFRKGTWGQNGRFIDSAALRYKLFDEKGYVRGGVPNSNYTLKYWGK
jgi:hypothetical protein